MGLWQQCVRALEFQLKEEDISMWVRPIKAFESEGTLSLVAPNDSVAKWVRENCLSRIEKTLVTASQTPVDLLLSINTHAPDGPQYALENQGNGRHPPQPRLASFLNKNQTFATFIEGRSNQIAKASAQQIAKNPGGGFNPFFLYSGVGLGKTHLMHAIGNEITRNYPDARVLYMYSERFVEDMVRALREDKMEKFKKFYRSVDVLLIDDVQFFAGKERSQEEFFHTFNTLLQSQRQVVMTCDRYPKDIDNVQERLKSRFGCGLTQDIEPPDIETRTAIVQSKAEQLQMQLEEPVAFFIAKNIHSNVRELEGAVRRVQAGACGKPPTLELARRVLQDALASHSRALTIEDIQKVVAKFYNVRVSDLLAKSRMKVVTFPRQIAMALTKEMTNHSLPTIGDAFGGRDHTTVIHACRKIEKCRQNDPKVDNDIKLLRQELNS